ncbi:MAG: hypothetical protein EHM70_12680 [Chloroflexota bacterium]|nr:MAG: hypothetical protein EHM70_12680 [Chloroflexota bacterium]
MNKILIAVILLSLAGCSQAGESMPNTPAPTGTPTVTSTPTATSLPTFTPVPTAVPGGLYVDAAQNLGNISPLVYGTNYGPWVSVPYELLPQAEALKITYLRYPGGEHGDNFDLTRLQIDQYISFCKQMGALPNISVRLKNGTPEKAAELVRYTNIEKGYNVRYWSIGNEPSLFASAERIDYDSQRYNQEWRAYAEAMLAVDPDLILVGPDIHQFTSSSANNPKDAGGLDWMEEFLKANGDLVDVVSIHRYPFPTGRDNAPPAIEELRENSREWDAIIPLLRQVIRATTGRDIPIAVTEINSNWSHAIGGEATPDSFYNAIWWGDVLGRLIRQRVEIVAHFVLVSKGNQGGWGLLESYGLRPSYYVYMLYQKFGSELIYASSDHPDVSVYAAKRQDGALTLMFVNLGPEPIDIPLRIDDFTSSVDVEAWLFDQDHFAEVVDEATLLDLPLDASSLAHLPGQSMALVALR